MSAAAMPPRTLAAHGLDPSNNNEAAVRFFMRTQAARLDFEDSARGDLAEPTAPAPPARFGDLSRQGEAARAAYRNGLDRGHDAGVRHGFRWGVIAATVVFALGLFVGRLLFA